MGIKSYIVNLPEFLKHGGIKYVSVTFTNLDARYINKKVFISGGSEGLGRAMAKAYSAEGVEVIVTERGKEKLSSFQLSENNAKLRTLVWGALNFDSYRQKFGKAVSMMGRIDIFVSSIGGRMSKYEPWSAYTAEVLDRTYDINTESIFLTCQMEGPYMIGSKIKGSILNITSITGYRGLFNPYVVAKWGVHSLTGGIARKLITYDVVVNGITPGTYLTSNPALPHNRDFENNAYFQGQPSKHFTMPEEIAKTVLFLTSGEARQIVGYIIPVDGGVLI